MVRSAACKLLLTHFDAKQLPAYISHLKTHADEYVREHVALVIGKIGGKSALAAVKGQAAVEQDADAKHAMSIALVRLKDQQSTTDYTNRLQSPDPAERVKALEDYTYIEERALLPEIAGLLSDERDAKNMAPGGHKYFIRVCDVAVNSLDVVLSHPFPFPIDRLKRYSTEELNQAKQIARSTK
jgi:HEAT repeat protein